MMKKSIDVLLVYPNPTADSPVQLTPLSILFPGAWFKAQGLQVAYYDQRFDAPEVLDDLIMQAKEIAVSAMTGYQCGQAADILLKAKSMCPDIIASVGGHHARIMPSQVLAEPFVDKIYPESNYGLDLFPLDEQTLPIFKRGELQYFTSTGCPFGCRFCAVSMPWQPRSIEQLSHELNALHEATGFNRISFADPNITHSFYKNGQEMIKVDVPERMRNLGFLMRRFGATWESNMRCPDLTPEIVEILAEGNCTDLEIGCESGSEHVIRKIVRKGHGVDAIKRAVRNVSGSGISTMYSFLAFMPGETLDDVFQTMDLIDWITQTDPLARVSIYNFTPYPGTPLYADALAGKGNYPPFASPKSMKEWGAMRLMASPLYWIAGLNFRLDNSRKNFPGEDWALIEPFILQAQKQWRSRDILHFPVEEVESLIARQLEKQHQLQIQHSQS